jgi:short-subunit dehydrogenase
MTKRFALITGTSSGFGKVLTEEYLNQGHVVYATMRGANKRSELQDLKDKFPETLKIHSLDVTQTAEIDELFDLISKETQGKLDVLINNAGAGSFGAFEDYQLDEIRALMETNFFSVINMTKRFLPLLRSSKGRVINLSSMMGEFSMPLSSVYCASKYALEGLSEGLYYELSLLNVEVCTIRPGGHRTNFMNSVKWASNSTNPHSAYARVTAGIKGLMDKKISKADAPGAENIRPLIKYIISSPKLPRSLYLGKDAFALRILRAFLPSSLYYFMMNFSYHKILAKNGARG